MTTDVKAARQEIEQILRNICETDAYALGSILVDVRNDLIVMKHIKKVDPNVGPGQEIELSGGILGRLTPALKELCSPARLNLGDPAFSIIIANRGIAIIHILTPEFVIVVYGMRGMNISYIVQQLVQSHKRLRILIDQAQLKTEVSEWGI